MRREEKMGNHCLTEWENNGVGKWNRGTRPAPRSHLKFNTASGMLSLAGADTVDRGRFSQASLVLPRRCNEGRGGRELNVY